MRMVPALQTTIQDRLMRFHLLMEQAGTTEPTDQTTTLHEASLRPMNETHLYFQLQALHNSKPQAYQTEQAIQMLAYKLALPDLVVLHERKKGQIFSRTAELMPYIVVATIFRVSLCSPPTEVSLSLGSA
jgi:hypothetical protein